MRCSAFSCKDYILKISVRLRDGSAGADRPYVQETIEIGVNAQQFKYSERIIVHPITRH